MRFQGQKILVTGGAGFIGSHLCEQLLKEGAEVSIFDNFITGKMSNLESIKKEIKIIKGDIKNADEIEKATNGQNIIIHEAFPYGTATRDVDKQFVADGGEGTFNVLRAALKNDVQKVVYASSVAIYGLQNYALLDEDHSKNPFLPYGATKYVGELYCSTFARVYGLDTVSLRYFNVFGPRYATFDHSAMIIFLQRSLKKEPLLIYGNGKQIRDYTYIDDIVEGTILATIKEKTMGVSYNLGKGSGIAISNLAKKIVALTKSKSKIRAAKIEEYRFIEKGLPYGITKKLKEGFIDERNLVADITRAREDLGYQPKVSFEDGIIKTFEWMSGKT